MKTNVANNIFTSHYSNWPFYVLLLLVACVVFLWVTHKKEVKVLFSTVGQVKLAEQYFRNKEVTSTIVNLLLSSNYFITIGLLVSIIFYDYLTSYESEYIVITCILFFALLYVSRKLYGLFLKLIVPFGVKVLFYHSTLENLNKIFGLILLPFLAILYYGNPNFIQPTLYLIFVLYIILLVIRLFNFFMIGRSYLKFHKFYFFTYFCTSELLPNLLLIKLIF